MFPRRIAPASSNRETSGAFAEGMCSLRSSDPAGQGHPATSILDFMVSGIPASGGNFSSLRIADSH